MYTFTGASILSVFIGGGGGIKVLGIVSFIALCVWFSETPVEV